MKKLFCLVILSILLVTALTSCGFMGDIYHNMIRMSMENMEHQLELTTEVMEKGNSAFTEEPSFRVVESAVADDILLTMNYNENKHCVTVNYKSQGEPTGLMTRYIMLFVNDEGAVTAVIGMESDSQEQHIFFEESNEDIETTLNAAGWIQKVEYWHTQKFVCHYDNYIDNRLTKIDRYYYNDWDGWGEPYTVDLHELEEDVVATGYTTTTDESFKMFENIGWLLCMIALLG